MKIRKQTRLWTTADGTRVRICNMDDLHLLATIALLELWAEHNHEASIKNLTDALNYLQGDYAVYFAGMDLDHLLQSCPTNALDEDETYCAMLLERDRRGLTDRASRSIELFEDTS